MIYGTIVLVDIAIQFTCIANQLASVQIMNTFTGELESYTCPQADFLAALSIAVHNDGEPDYRKDYPAAESAMRTIRWIP
jgi:hypothetical protein